jgi:Flp pilus assembly protein CpaB
MPTAGIMAATAVAVSTGRAPDATAPRRRPLSRLSAGHLVMVLAGLVGVVLSLAAIRSPGAGGAAVLVATRDLEPGETIRSGDVQESTVRASRAVLDAFVPAGEAARLRGRVATAAVGQDEPITRRAVRPPSAPSGLRAMSIPVDAARAVSGHLAPGDRVDVVFAGEREASIIVADAEVLAVDARARGGINGSSSSFAVTIAVDAEQSELVAAAIEDGHFSITRTTGADRAVGVRPLSLDRAEGAG